MKTHCFHYTGKQIPGQRVKWVDKCCFCDKQRTRVGSTVVRGHGEHLKLGWYTWDKSVEDGEQCMERN